MELGYYFILWICICPWSTYDHLFLPPLKTLSDIPVDIAGFGRQTSLDFWYTPGRENTLQNSFEFQHFAGVVANEYYGIDSKYLQLNM